MDKVMLSVIADMIDMVVQGKVSTTLKESGNTRVRVYQLYPWMIRVDLINTERRPLTLAEWKPLVRRTGKE
jgi:hypothetical protein